MKRLPLYVLLASALTFLVSLFLPWRETTTSALVFGTDQGQPALFRNGGIVGWSALAGDVAVLLVVATVLTTVAALHRPQLAPRLPIGSLGVALGYFAVAVALEVHALGQVFSGAFTGTPHAAPSSWAYGFYLGLTSAGLAVLSAVVYRWRGLPPLPGASDALAVLLGSALLVSFLLPWLGLPGGETANYGIQSAPAAIAALALILGGGWLLREAGQRWRLPVAGAIAVLTGGAASDVSFSYDHRYGTWIGVGCAVSLVALEAVRAWPVRLPVLPRGLTAVRAGAAALLSVALFLPWQQLHAGLTPERTADGWSLVTGAAAGGLCLLLLAFPALPALESYVLDTVVAVAVFATVAGTAVRAESSFLRIGYGAFLGIAAAGILLVTALVPLRVGHVDRRRALARAVPLGASVLCVAAVVVSLWFVLPVSWRFQAGALSGGLAVPGVLLGLYLLRLWALRVRSPEPAGHGLTLAPLVLLALASLELIRYRNAEVIWSAVILVGLCLLLALCGWIEERRGLENVRVPDEIWRVDRLPEAES
jgi:hypothetical protein